MFTNLLRVEEGGAVFLTEEHLLIRDVDTLPEGLRVRLDALPHHGRLELQGSPLLEGHSFSLLDLRALRVRWMKTLRIHVALWIDYITHLQYTTDIFKSLFSTLFIHCVSHILYSVQLGSIHDHIF